MEVSNTTLRKKYKSTKTIIHQFEKKVHTILYFVISVYYEVYVNMHSTDPACLEIDKELQCFSAENGCNKR